MATELEPASLAIHSRAPVGSKRATHFRRYVCSKIDAIRKTLGPLEQKMDAYEFFHQIVEPNCENALRPRIILG